MTHCPRIANDHECPFKVPQSIRPATHTKRTKTGRSLPLRVRQNLKVISHATRNVGPIDEDGAYSASPHVLENQQPRQACVRTANSEGSCCLMSLEAKKMPSKYSHRLCTSTHASSTAFSFVRRSSHNAASSWNSWDHQMLGKRSGGRKTASERSA